MAVPFALLPNRPKPLTRQYASADLSESDSDGFAYSPITFAPASIDSHFSADALVNSDVETYATPTLGDNFNSGPPIIPADSKLLDYELHSNPSLDSFHTGDFDYSELDSRPTGSTRFSSVTDDSDGSSVSAGAPLLMHTARSASPYLQVSPPL